MTVKKTLTLLTAVAVIALTFTTGTVQASQKSKNTWRNATAGSAAVLGLGLLTHNKTAIIAGAAGTAYSAHRYEQDRHHQSQHSAAYHRRHRHRRHH